MEILNFNQVPQGFLPASAVTIGNFDGVHIGHRAIIKQVLEFSSEHRVSSVVITFDPHPREVIYKGQEVPAILTFSERARLIRELGVDYLVKVDFTPEFASREADWFVEEVVAMLSPRLVVVGHDFRFGKGRKGDAELLGRAGRRFGFSVVSVPAVEVLGKPVSSTRIRGLVQAGEMGRAHLLLGEPFNIHGKVIHGHGRGKDVGFATANLSWKNRLIPPEGVYAAVACWDGQRCPAVVNIGANPTFNDRAISIEAHIMGFSGDLYDRNIRLALYQRLRGEIKFESAEALAEQIKKDVQKARQILIEEAGEDLFDGVPGPFREKNGSS
ncbi:MAG: bifunctional riboflavin kinase/FAD synthetase [bacterium]